MPLTFGTSGLEAVFAAPPPGEVKPEKRKFNFEGDTISTDYLKPGQEVPLTGGAEFHLPFGVFRTPNITPDVETGIGARRDEAGGS